MAKENTIVLPRPVTKGKISLEEAILKRRSVRNFVNKDLSLEQISQLLWSAQGITGEKGTFNFRAAPSAGALYPMEIYLVTKDGLFHYLVQEHGLERLAKDDIRNALAEAALGQGSVRQAPANIVICAVFSRVAVKYGERGGRYAFIEAGHIAENVHLQAAALGLGSVPVGAFDDIQVKKVLTLPKEEEPLYIIPIGYAK